MPQISDMGGTGRVDKSDGRHSDGGHFDSASCGCSDFYWRDMTRNTLPLSVRHLHPRIGPLDIQVDYLA